MEPYGKNQETERAKPPVHLFLSIFLHIFVKKKSEVPRHVVATFVFVP
jgi:hypothetical protein